MKKRSLERVVPQVRRVGYAVAYTRHTPHARPARRSPVALAWFFARRASHRPWLRLRLVGGGGGRWWLLSGVPPREQAAGEHTHIRSRWGGGAIPRPASPDGRRPRRTLFPVGVAKLVCNPVSQLVAGWQGLLFQIAQQSSEHFLVGVMLLPPREVGDVAHAAQVGRPTDRTVLDRIIQANRKQHQLFLPALLVEGIFDFVFDPRTLDGMLREHQQQLVIQTNRLVDTVTYLVAGLEVFGSEPTTHASALQIGIQPFDKLLILARIADEASVVFIRQVEQAGHIGQKALWNASSSQEAFGYLPSRAIQRADADIRWPQVIEGFQSLDAPQVNSIKMCPSDLSIGHSYICETVETEIGSNEVGSAEVSSAKGSSFEVGIEESSETKVGFSEVGITEVGFSEVGIVEVGFAKVGSYVWMCLSPSIPCLNALLQNEKLFWVCHDSSLLSLTPCVPIIKQRYDRHKQPGGCSRRGVQQRGGLSLLSVASKSHKSHSAKYISGRLVLLCVREMEVL